MNGLTLLVLIAVAAGGFLLFRLGVRHGERQPHGSNPLSAPIAQAKPIQSDRTIASTAASGAPVPDRRVAANDRRSVRTTAVPAASPSPAAIGNVRVDAASVDGATTFPANADSCSDEHARLVRTLAVETFALRRDAATVAGEATQLMELAEDRHRLLRELADARGATARYRQLVVDLENDAPPPLLTNAHALDDLKLVVGIGPMLERMLQQLGITTYRQIARWSERDIAEFDAKLPEFPGRIRRDEWVKQARALHQSKYGEVLSARG